jgi:hypothetical protein
MGTDAPSGTSRTGKNVAYVVVSAGPYMFSNVAGGAARSTRRNDSASAASPPVSRQRTLRNASGISVAT